MKTTRKKSKIIGEQQLFTEDGEIISCHVVQIEERDANFHKIWLGHIIQSLDLIGNQKIRLANFILANLDRENKLVMTQRKIAEKSGISIGTIISTMKALQEGNFLTKINSGAYQVNPDIIFKGGKNDRMNILLQYHAAKAPKKDNESVSVSEEAKLETEGQTTIFQPEPEPAAVDPEPEIHRCKDCGTVMEEKTNRSTGEKFLGCPNWKNHKKTKSA